MTFSPELKSDIHIISLLNPEKDSVILSSRADGCSLKRIEKRSRTQNFFRWCIHIITLTLVPCNAKLDEVTRRILNETKSLSSLSITNKEKNLLTHAVKNLRTILQQNGGRYEEEVDQLLVTIHKIRTLNNEFLEKTIQTLQDIEEIDFKLLMEECKKADISILQFMANFDDFKSLLPKLSADTQANLISQVLQATRISYEKEYYKKFLDVAETLPSSVWEKASKKIPDLKFYRILTSFPPRICAAIFNEQAHNSDFVREFFIEYFMSGKEEDQKEFIKYVSPNVVSKFTHFGLYNHKYGQIALKNFFSILDQCEDVTHKWSLFDHATACICMSRPGVFDQDDTKFIPDDLYLLYALSKEQSQRLGLEKKYESHMSLFSAIHSRRLHLPETHDQMAAFVRDMDSCEDKNQQRIFLIFLDSYFFLNYLKFDAAADLSYFISWLGGLNPKPEMLGPCVREIYNTLSRTNTPRSNLIKLIRNIPYNVLKDHLVSIIIHNNNKFQLDLIIEIIKLYKPQDARTLIDKEWDILSKIKNESVLMLITFKELLLNYTDDLKKWEYLLEEPGSALSQLNHWERYPWKLLLSLPLGKSYFSQIEERIQINYPICRALLQQEFTQEKVKRLKQELLLFFDSAKNKRFEEALAIYNRLDDEIKGYFLVMTRDSTAEVLCKELPYLNEAQLLVALLDPESNKNMLGAIAWELQNRSLSKDILAPIIDLAMNLLDGKILRNGVMQNLFIRDRENSLLEAFLNHSLDIPPPNGFLLNKCYNNDQPIFSDLSFNLGNETLHVHRAFLSSDPMLMKYVPTVAQQTITISDIEEAKIIKSAIKQLYSFHLRDLIIPRPEIKSLYNNKNSYPDFVIACAGEEIHVHRIMLSVGIPHYFQGLLGHGFTEAKAGRLELSNDKFHQLKLVVKYIYTWEIPEFGNNASCEDFYEALDFYQVPIIE